jgi:hypothetical protein
LKLIIKSSGVIEQSSFQVTALPVDLKTPLLRPLPPFLQGNRGNIQRGHGESALRQISRIATLAAGDIQCLAAKRRPRIALDNLAQESRRLFSAGEFKCWLSQRIRSSVDISIPAQF